MRRVIAVCALASLGGIALGAPLPDRWNNWRYSRPLSLDPAVEAPLMRAALPIEVYGHSQEGLADLRLVDEAGDEVPHVLHARRGTREREWRATKLSEIGFVSGRYTQVVADAGADGMQHNSLALEIDMADFFAWVEVAASDDRRTWRMLRDRAPVYRFEKESLQGTQTISYPETRSRWLRLRLLVGDERIPVASCRVAHELVEQAELAPLPVQLLLDPGSTREQSRWRADLGSGNVPASVVRFSTSRDEFHRPVRVSVSADDEIWREIDQQEIYRHRIRDDEPAGEGDRSRSKLEVEFPEANGRYWMVIVFNRNDAPIEDVGATLLGTPRYVVFRHEPGRSYRLLYGNSRVEGARYELARLITREDSEAAPLASLGAEQTNEAYVSPEPWTERNPVVLWAALGLAVAVLAWLAIRSLRR